MRSLLEVHLYLASLLDPIGWTSYPVVVHSGDNIEIGPFESEYVIKYFNVVSEDSDFPVIKNLDI